MRPLNRRCGRPPQQSRCNVRRPFVPPLATNEWVDMQRRPPGLEGEQLAVDLLH